MGKVTETELKESGLEKGEMEMIEKTGLVKKAGDVKPDEGVKDTGKQGEKNDGKEEQTVSQKIKNGAYDNLSPEEEKELTKTYTDNEKGLYFARKKERQKRQLSQAERDYERTLRIKAEERLAELEKSLQELKKEGASSDKGAGNDDLEKIFESEEEALAEKDKKSEGGEKEEKLTAEEWEKKRSLIQREREVRAKMISQKLDMDAAEFKENSGADDLDETLNLASDVFKNHEALFNGDPDKLEDIKRKIRQWTLKAADCTRDGADNMAELAYKIGQMHPKYKKNDKNSDSGAKTEEKGDKLTDEQIKKLKEGKKEISSASIGGGDGVGGKNDEITYEKLKKMSLDDYRKLSKEAREKLLGKPTG